MSIIDDALSANVTMTDGYAGQVLQLHRPREEHQGADPEGQVASVDLAGGPDQGVRVRRQHRAAQRSVPGRGDRHWLTRVAGL
jgi:hypothetical protein